PTRGTDGRPAVLVLLLDVTRRRAAEAARDELSADLRRVQRAQQFLLRASDVLAAAGGYEETLDRLCRLSVPTLGDLCLIDVVERRRLRRVAAVAADPARQPLADELRTRYGLLPGSHHPALEAMRSGTRWEPEVDEAWIRGQARDERHAELHRQLGTSGFVAVPLLAGGEVLGTLTVLSTAGRRFGPDDVALVEALAGRVALVVAKERRYEREHRIAEVLQRSMLTRLPVLPGLELAARYVPAREDTHVGGDWHDAFAFPGEDPVVVIGDVVGHDVDAAAQMGQLRNALRGLAYGRRRPAAVLEALDALVSGLAVTELASVVYAALAPVAGGRELRWSNAGHLPPLLLPAGRPGAARFLDPEPDPFVGVSAFGRRREHRAVLPAGSTLLLYTDGLVESRDSQLERGLEELRDLAVRSAALPLPALCDALLEDLGRGAEDDVALLAVRVLSG
ncbi:PP2C family protein-serine/threonine phosphatase, partial [Kineococcus glutinatus]|uniref:PP2C family protein-serine/threonine phosphatase n=1 Tax=Kineococcus glutinatus TaxID=1070872 RepID=UPI0031ED277C